MIPQSDVEMTDEELEPVQLPGRTYRFDFNNGRVSSHKVDGIEAVKQTVFKILSTRRFDHLIYSGNYGNEMDLSAVRGRVVFESEVERWVSEALTQDDRISAVTGFSFNYQLDTVQVRFTVETDFGSYQEEQEV
ncbi:DUF2634 domain-containing protein [Paenibacillus solani]|uniref:DUF2634 domain-containing protein n=1 Tax=Paenibacillus solani TaxID=1705565 RepID=UPI003D293F19